MTHLLIMEMSTTLNGIGIDMTHLLTLNVFGITLEECKAAAATLSYDLPNEVTPQGLLGGRVFTTCL